jgi:hypothetical protein
MTTYEQAHAEITAATKLYSAARTAYRKMLITEAEFLAELEVYTAAEAKFDAAYTDAELGVGI